MEIASMDLSSNSLRRSVKPAGRFLPVFSISSKRWFSTDSSTSQTAAISTFGIAEYARMWFRPWPWTPTHATRTVSLGLAKAVRFAKAAVEVIRKCLRCIPHSPFPRHRRSRFYYRIVGTAEGSR